MPSLAEQDRAIIDELKSACCCPECGKYPCPPSSWYADDNPYRIDSPAYKFMPRVVVQLGKVNRYFDTQKQARTALDSFNAKRTNRLGA
jgi:hypothetical protein